MTPPFPAEEARRRAPWLVTLADLFMLLVGFFVFLQANTALDARAIGDGIRGGFGVALAPAPVPPVAPVQPAAPIPLEAGAITGFAPASSVMSAGAAAPALAWARAAAADPRTILTITGQTDGSAADVDPDTRSAAVLAADRARAAARLLAAVLPPERLRIATGTGARGVTLHIGFAGQKEPQP